MIAYLVKIALTLQWSRFHYRWKNLHDCHLDAHRRSHYQVEHRSQEFFLLLHYYFHKLYVLARWRIAREIQILALGTSFMKEVSGLQYHVLCRENRFLFETHG